jgi:glycosyltransferase involved in cell wall biosynthesis
MTTEPLISICIPAYKNTDFLKRLLDSILIQRFRDFEVIVSDDSPDMTVKDLCAFFGQQLPLHYYRNAQPLGTPENWNEAIRRARGAWIKIMHDDDWFTDENSLQSFAQAITEDPEASFFFSAYRDVFLDEHRSRDVFVSRFRYRSFLREHATLFSKNIVGPPSVVLHRNDPSILYDTRVKWVVDVDFYIRYLSGKTPVYIPRILISVGLSSQQVTRDCFGQRPIEIPENFLLLNKVGTGRLKNWLVYDAWWRLMRNLEIRRSAEIPEAGYTGAIPSVILSMVKWQSRIPRPLLKMGLFSKTLMLLHYLTHINRIPA